MDIKLKAKKTINKRITTSFVAVLMITLFVTIIIYSVLSRQFIVNGTRSDLRRAANVLESNIIKSMERSEEASNPLRQQTLKMLSDIEVFNDFMNLIVVVENKAGEIILPRQGWTRERVEGVIKQARLGQIDYIAYVHDLSDTDLPYKRWILLKRYEDVKVLRNMGLGAFIISFTIGILLALLMSYQVSKRLTKPIYHLKKAMDEYMTSKKNFEVYPSNDEIESLSKTFKQLASKVERLDEKQKNFFQNSSHELKTPLMSIQGYVEAIKDGIVTGQEYDDSLDIIISETQRLKSIVDDVIYLSKIDQLEDEFVLEEHCLKDIIEEAIDLVMPLLNAHHIEVNMSCSKDIKLICDLDKMKRVFINLIGNASRYARSKIIINANQYENNLTIDVIDDGKGFEYGQEEKVFDRFYNGKNGGSGIGLSLTKEIIEKHGGYIRAINNMNYGAVFKIEFRDKQ